MSKKEGNAEVKEFAGSRRHKSFAKFVDKVIQQVPLPVQKIDPYRVKEPTDPLEVLRSRGLLNIDKNTTSSSSRHVTNASPRSEVDLTFYTEETRDGVPVKLFSSTHRLKDGKLIYVTTQEMAPPETSFGESHGMSNPDKDFKHKSSKPIASRRVACYGKATKVHASPKEYENKVTHRSARPRNKFTQLQYPTSDSNNAQRSPKQEAVYHAVWHQASPRKIKGDNSKIATSRSGTSPSPTKQNYYKWMIPHHKLSPAHCISPVHHKSFSRGSSDVLVGCAVSHRLPARQESTIQSRPFTNFIYNYHDHPDVEFEESSNEYEDQDSDSVCVMRSEISPCFSKKGILGPVRSSADLDCGQGDYNRSKSSDSTTSICTTFYTIHDDERGSEGSGSLTSISYSSNDDNAQDRDNRRGCEGSSRKHQHTSVYSRKPQKNVQFDDNIKTRSSTRCSCKCHTSRLDVLEAGRSFSKSPKMTKEDDKDDRAMRVIKRMVNKEALARFAKKNSKGRRNVKRFNNEGTPKMAVLEERFDEWNKCFDHRNVEKDQRDWCSKEGYLMRSSISL